MGVGAVTELMHLHNVSSVLIETDYRRYVFSVEDLLNHIQAGKDHQSSLADVQLTEISTISESEHILAAMELMELSGGRYLGVVDTQQNLTGIVTYTDILAAVDPTILVQKKTIGELVARTEPVIFTADWILEDVLSHLRRMEDSIIVVEAKKPIGIITTKDIFKIISTGRAVDLPLSAYMVSPVITTLVSSSVHDALSQLKQFRIKRSIVVNELNQLVGVVTQSELVGFAYGMWIELIKHHSVELKELVAILEAKAIGFQHSTLFDQQTGLANQRMLTKRLSEEIERITFYHSPTFCLLLIEVNVLAQCNQESSQEMLAGFFNHLGLELSGLVKVRNDFAKLDSKKFAILAPCMEIHSTEILAANVRIRIADFACLHNLEIQTSMAIGQYAVDENGTLFFHRMNLALEMARQQGPNQLVIAAAANNS